jgi:hypothetical protein
LGASAGPPPLRMWRRRRSACPGTPRWPTCVGAQKRKRRSGPCAAGGRRPVPKEPVRVGAQSRCCRRASNPCTNARRVWVSCASQAPVNRDHRNPCRFRRARVCSSGLSSKCNSILTGSLLYTTRRPRTSTSSPGRDAPRVVSSTIRCFVRRISALWLLNSQPGWGCYSQLWAWLRFSCSRCIASALQPNSARVPLR